MNPNTNKEKYLENYPIPLTSESIEVILSQMKKNICKIYMDDGSTGTGFFCKIPYPDKSLLIPVLVTNNHLIDDSHLGKDKYIIFTINNDTIKYKIIIGDRKVYTSKLYDTTIIEIFEDKDNIKDFLELDFSIHEETFNNLYIKKSVYLLQYPKNEKVSVSYGIIKGIDLSNNFDISHLCSTKEGASGSPLMNITSKKLIGIHRGASNNYDFNKATLLVYPFKEFISKIKEKKIPKTHFILENDVKNVINQPTYLGNYRDKNLRALMSDNCEFNKNSQGYQIFGLIGDNLYGVLEGPPQTFYEYGYYYFIIIIPADYPLKTPKFYFQTKIFHPNIDEFGLVSVDILQDYWSPAQCRFEKIIYSVQSLLDDPNPYVFVNESAAKLYKENIKEYERVVRKYVSDYANFDAVQKELKKMNFEMEFN